MEQTMRNITTRIPLFIRVVSLYVVVAMFGLLGFQINTTLNRQNDFMTVHPQVTYSKKPVNYGTIVSKTIIDGEPVEFKMERLGIDLPVKYGYYDTNDNSWTASDDAIFYAYGTSLPNNQRGNTFLYGHNRDSVIAKLRDLVVGDEVTITTANGHTFIYFYTGDISVAPDYTDVLKDDPEKPRLTIMTCEGIFSLTRRLMYFDLKEAA